MSRKLGARAITGARVEVLLVALLCFAPSACVVFFCELGLFTVLLFGSEHIGDDQQDSRRIESQAIIERFRIEALECVSEVLFPSSLLRSLSVDMNFTSSLWLTEIIKISGLLFQRLELRCLIRRNISPVCLKISIGEGSTLLQKQRAQVKLPLINFHYQQNDDS